MTDDDAVSPRWSRWRAVTNLEEYHTRWDAMKAGHGEADLIETYRPLRVLDAGCGMGRVAIELDRRGITVEGADLDADLLAFARADAPHIVWHHADLTDMQLGRSFDLIAMPGNVMIFCRIDHRAPIVATLAGHLTDVGRLIAGFSLDRSADALTLAEYDDCCAAAGLTLVERYATWNRAPYDNGNYAVSVHQRKW